MSDSTPPAEQLVQQQRSKIIEGCLSYEDLCNTVETETGNFHKCFLDKEPKHTAHVCLCWYKWPADPEGKVPERSNE